MGVLFVCLIDHLLWWLEWKRLKTHYYLCYTYCIIIYIDDIVLNNILRANSVALIRWKKFLFTSNEGYFISQILKIIFILFSTCKLSSVFFFFFFFFCHTTVIMMSSIIVHKVKPQSASFLLKICPYWTGKPIRNISLLIRNGYQ